jgi:AcrR family transcriptional regulator
MRSTINHQDDDVNHPDGGCGCYGGVMAPRRRSDDETRVRDAERTKAALLDAAMAEFAAKGRAGARVSEIAERAGVNKQLISYYFGGKDGLYDAILERWYAQEAQLDEPGITLDELASRYLDAGFGSPLLQQLFTRELMDDDVSDADHDPRAPELLGLAERQANGEIADDLDPAFVLLMLQGMVISHALFRRDAIRLTGMDIDSPEYRTKADEQLRAVVRRLAARRP